VIASPERTQWLRDYYAALDGRRLWELAAFLHPDCCARYATGGIDTGREMIVERMATALGRLERIRHELIHVWEEDDEVIFELEVRYWRLDGVHFTRRGVGIFVLEDELIREQRLFVNDSAVWR
jgi:ketosteroid isomerase-like protein